MILMPGAEWGARSCEALTDRLLEMDATLQHLARRLHLRQRRLKQAVSPAQYRLYLLIEDAGNDRWLELVRRVWSIARSRGRGEVCGRESFSPYQADRCTYRVKWCDSEELFVASCEELPWISWRDPSRSEALAGIVRLVRDMEASAVGQGARAASAGMARGA